MQLKKIFSNPLVSGTISLTAVGLFTRVMGFLFRIFLSKTIGEEGMGLYQLATPVLGICMSVSALSLQTALSRMIASYSTLKHRQDIWLLRAALGCALALSALFIAVLYPASGWVCSVLLHEERCTSLLRMLLLSLPFSCIHTCLCGYYFGRNETKQPAVSQLAEQSVRIGSIFLIWYVRSRSGHSMTLEDIAAGSVISEMAAALYLTLVYLYERGHHQSIRTLSYHAILHELAATSLPLCANRLCLTVLQTVESILIPLCLRRYGMSASEALSLFGVLTGMALPFIMFPSTLTNSTAVLLLPKIASDTAAGSHDQVKKAAGASLSFCLWLGIFCLVFFLALGPLLGRVFFQSILAGSYIRALAWMSPFIYLGITCSSILNGLGRLSAVFLHNLSCLLLRLAGVVFLIPLFGINGYLLGMLTSQLLLCILHLAAIRRTLKKV